MDNEMINPFDWDFSNNGIEEITPTEGDGGGDGGGSSSGGVTEETVNNIVDEKLDTISLQGENLTYNLFVNGNNVGTINIPEDQFLKNVEYDSESKEIIFTMNTDDGEKTVNVSIADLISSVEEEIENIELQLDNFETKENVSAIAQRVTVLENGMSAYATQSWVQEQQYLTQHQDISNLATKQEVNEVDEKVNNLEIPSIVGLASEEWVEEQGFLTEHQDISNLATNDEVELKADKSDVYTRTETDEKFQASGDYVPADEYDALINCVLTLENYVNIFIKDREEKMDEIINNMDADNKEVVIETPMESIVVPETTVAYTISAPLADNSTVELTSPKYMTLFNTSEEPVSTTIGHTFVEGETTSATTVYLVGDFDTLTLENVSPAVKSGQDAATVNNVVISENNVKNLTLTVSLQDGATITNNSNTSVTIQDKNDIATTLTIVAPNSTVTLNGGTFTTLDATVADETLIIKKITHIENLNVLKGNVQVEVSRASDIATIVENYTLAEGCEISYLSDEIDTTNVANLQKAGEHTLVDDVTRTGNFSTGTFSTDDIVWKLNGHSITCDSTRGIGGFLLRNASKLEVNGNGSFSVIDDGYGLWASGANVRIVVNGGDFSASTHVLYCEKGIIEINGGTFRLTNEDTADRDENGNFKFLLNCLDANYRNGDANIIVRGGKFYDFDPGNCVAEGANTNFVANGYVSVMTTETIDGVEHKVYTIQAAS